VEHIQDSWTVEDISNFAKNSIDNPTVLTKMISQITEEPAGDWTECTICLDVPNMPVMTTCRHVFCSECINGVFDMPGARGEVASEDDEEVEALGESIACPVCRHKLERKDLGEFTPPKDKNAPIPPEEARESFRSINWESHSDDESDNESLPDLATTFLRKKPVAKKEAEKKETVPAKVELPPLPSLEDIGAPREDEDLFALFKSLPVPKVAVKKDRQNVSENWAELLDGDHWQSSSKLDAMRDQLREWRESHSEDKVIIFSQFVRALDLVEKICNEEGWNCLRYQGDMTLDQREATLRSFEDDPGFTFMLTSLKCGGVGLNLTSILRIHF
jgi:Helicase conserved C-terminal domain/RING-type zinc-finger